MQEKGRERDLVCVEQLLIIFVSKSPLVFLLTLIEDNMLFSLGTPTSIFNRANFSYDYVPLVGSSILMNKLFRAFFLSVNERQGSGKLDDVCNAKKE